MIDIYFIQYAREIRLLNVIDFYQFLRVERLDIRRFVFLDESHVNDRSRSRLYGRSLRGIRPTFTHAFVRGIRYTVSVAANYQGIVDYVVLRGGCNGHLFFRWFVSSLYQALDYDSILVMDNAAIHHYAPFVTIAEYLEVDIIYLPPYCPFLNPVEYIFAALKRAVQRYRVLMELYPVQSLTLMMEELRGFDVLGLLRRIGYHYVCKFPTH